MARKISTKQAQLEKEYRKQRRRVQQAIRRAEKSGYITTKEVLKNKPKKITQASINALAKITPETIRKKSVLVNLETGEQVKKTKENIKSVTKKNRHIVKQQAQQQAQQQSQQVQQQQQQARQLSDQEKISDVIYDNFLASLDNVPLKAKVKFLAKIEKLVEQFGQVAFTNALQEMPHDFFELLQRMNYDSDQASNEYASTLIVLIKNLLFLSDAEVQELEDIYDSESDITLEMVEEWM